MSISWGGPESSWTATVDDGAGSGDRRRRRARHRRLPLRPAITAAATASPMASRTPISGVQPARARLRGYEPARRPGNGHDQLRDSLERRGGRRRDRRRGQHFVRAAAWQATVGVPTNPAGAPGRGVPDVAGNADPATGYQVLIDGQQTVIGGTSAVAPLWAALMARLAQSLGKSFGLIQQVLYAGVRPARRRPDCATSPAAVTAPTRRGRAGTRAPAWACRTVRRCWPVCRRALPPPRHGVLADSRPLRASGGVPIVGGARTAEAPRGSPRCRARPGSSP